MNRGKRRIVLVAGGSGGHLFPAIAVAEECYRHKTPAILLTDRRGARFVKGYEKIFDKIKIVPSLGFVSEQGWLPKILTLGFLAIESLGYFLIARPLLVWGFGGKITFFPVLWARLLGITCGIHQSDRVLGRANRLLARITSHVMVGYERTEKVPKGVKYQTIGVPVRSGFEHISPLSHLPEKLHITILGGSQGAVMWNTVVPQALAAMPAEDQCRLVILHQCPRMYHADLEKAYQATQAAVKLVAFIEDMPTVLEASHLVLSRSGASTVAELMLSGRPAFFVPYPFSTDQHQWWNAQYVVQKEGGWLCRQEDLSPEKLAKFLSQCLHNSQKLIYASRCMRAMGKPNVAARMYAYFCHLSPSYKAKGWRHDPL